MLLLLFAIMIESKRRLLEICSNLPDAPGQLLVLQAAGVAPSGEILVELGVINACPLGYLLGMEAIKVVEERADVVLELDYVLFRLQIVEQSVVLFYISQYNFSYTQDLKYLF